MRTRAFESLAAMGSSDWPVTLLDGEPVARRTSCGVGRFLRDARRPGCARAHDRRRRRPARRCGRSRHQPRALAAGVRRRSRRSSAGRSRSTTGPFTIVGVMPRGFTYPFGTDAWSALVPALAGIGQPELPNFLATREAAVLHVVGRLKRDVSVAAARADLDRVIREVVPRYGIADVSSSRIRPLSRRVARAHTHGPLGADCSGCVAAARRRHQRRQA